MKKALFQLVLMLFVAAQAQAAPKPKAKPMPAAVDSAAVYRAIIDSIQGSFRYQTGHLTLPGGVGELTVPAGYR